MNRKLKDFCCSETEEKAGQPCIRRENYPDNARPLSKACRCERFKVCKVQGDRKLCARMAHLGVFPGSEIEVICPIQSQNCVVKVKGCTVSLDQLSADNILVTPV